MEREIKPSLFPASLSVDVGKESSEQVQEGTRS